MEDLSKDEQAARWIASELGRVHQGPKLRFGPPLDTCIECLFAEASDALDTGIQVGAGYIIVDREECQSMRHVEEGE
jgi:hypothetical protein